MKIWKWKLKKLGTYVKMEMEMETQRCTIGSLVNDSIINFMTVVGSRKMAKRSEQI